MMPHIPFKISLIDNKPTFVVENFAIKSFTIKKMLLHDISENTMQKNEPFESLKDYTFRLKHLEVDFNLMTIKRIMDNDLFTLHSIATQEGYLVFSGKYRHENNYIDISFKCFYYPFVGTKF